MRADIAKNVGQSSRSNVTHWTGYSLNDLHIVSSRVQRDARRARWADDQLCRSPWMILQGTWRGRRLFRARTSRRHRTMNSDITILAHLQIYHTSRTRSLQHSRTWHSTLAPIRQLMRDSEKGETGNYSH